MLLSEHIQIDNDREWIQWVIEDEEWWIREEQWDRDTIPGYRDYPFERGVIEDYM